MANPDPQALLTAANCYSCFGSDRGSMELLKLALLQKILLAQNPNAVTDPQTLLSQASCYSCFASSPGLMQLLELALLGNIAANGAGASGSVLCGSGAPSNANAPTGSCGIYYDNNPASPTYGQIWQWSGTAWV